MIFFHKTFTIPKMFLFTELTILTWCKSIFSIYWLSMAMRLPSNKQMVSWSTMWKVWLLVSSLILFKSEVTKIGNTFYTILMMALMMLIRIMETVASKELHKNKTKINKLVVILIVKVTKMEINWLLFAISHWICILVYCRRCLLYRRMTSLLKYVQLLIKYTPLVLQNRM